MALKKPATPSGLMMDLHDLMMRTGVMYPPVEQFIERWGGVADAEAIIAIDPKTNHRAVPEDIALRAIVAFEKECAENLAARREFEAYKAALAADAKSKRLEAAQRERERREKLSEKAREEAAKMAAERAARRPTQNVAAHQVRKNQARDLAGRPLDFATWKKKGSPAS
jgi:hypothetical protein